MHASRADRYQIEYSERFSWFGKGNQTAKKKNKTIYRSKTTGKRDERRAGRRKQACTEREAKHAGGRLLQRGKAYGDKARKPEAHTRVNSLYRAVVDKRLIKHNTFLLAAPPFEVKSYTGKPQKPADAADDFLNARL